TYTFGKEPKLSFVWQRPANQVTMQIDVQKITQEFKQKEFTAQRLAQQLQRLEAEKKRIEQMEAAIKRGEVPPLSLPLLGQPAGQPGFGLAEGLEPLPPFNEPSSPLPPQPLFGPYGNQNE